MSAYGHVIEELEDQPSLSAEEAIRQARERVVPVLVPLASGQQPEIPSAPSWIRTSGLLLRRESLYPTELSGRTASLLAVQRHAGAEMSSGVVVPAASGLSGDRVLASISAWSTLSG
jgi:hypothetical protein